MQSILFSIFYHKKQNWLPLLLLIACLPLIAQVGNPSCHEKKQFHNLELHQNLEQFTANFIKNPQSQAQSRGAITIPVVVHIVYQSETENFSDQQVQTQIAALNRDFNRENTNLDKVHPDFSGLIGRVGFNFCLASSDPDGNPTTGITRTRTDEDSEFFNGADWIYYNNRGGKDAWQPEQYLNIWVTKSSGRILGFGSKPGENAPLEDGVVIGSQYFTNTPPFHLGRTLTHEVGHYFNLFHPWGSDSELNCGGSDFVKDTPSQSEQYFGCPDLNSTSCDSRDITANFMNLSDDECLAMFTHGQVNRMQAALVGARSGLLNTEGCDQIMASDPIEDISIYPNPASYYFCIETKELSSPNVRLRILDSRGALVQNEVDVLPNHTTFFKPNYEGIYFLQFLVGEKETITKKVIVRR